MNELKCRECGNMVSATVKFCPKCGCPVVNATNDTSSTGNQLEETQPGGVQLNNQQVEQSQQFQTYQSTIQQQQTTGINNSEYGSMSDNLDNNGANKNKRSFNEILGYAIPAVTLIIGIIIVLLGGIMMKKPEKMKNIGYKESSVSSAAFGGDFYTEIYDAADEMVDELDNINKNIYYLDLGIYYVGGMLMIGIGSVVVSLSLLELKKSIK